MALAIASTVLVGCDLLHNQHQLRSKTTEADHEEEEHEEDNVAAKVRPVESESSKGFFHSTRLPGALSDEGRDIEKHLGIP